MTIKEVEASLGIARANVRFYEKEGILFPKRNPLNDYRDYSKEDVETLRKIIFLRNLGVSVEEIRGLQRGRMEMQAVLKEQITRLEAQREKSENACRICQELLLQKGSSFETLKLPEMEDAVNAANVTSFGDVLSELGMFWDKLVVYGFFVVQILYTIIVYPFLPERIPISWSGMLVTEYAGKWYFLFYLVLYGILTYLCRLVLYQWLLGGLRCYMDEIYAFLAVGALGIGFSTQIYTVLFLRGFGVTVDTFLLICGSVYVVVAALLTLFCLRRKKSGRKR